MSRSAILVLALIAVVAAGAIVLAVSRDAGGPSATAVSDGERTHVDAPGTSVTTDRDKVRVQAPGVDVTVPRDRK